MDIPLIEAHHKKSSDGPSGEAWGFAGWGTSESVLLAKLRNGQLVSTSELEKHSSQTLNTLEINDSGGRVRHANLGPWLSTSIAGNDLLSSCLYVGGICTSSAGKMAPLSLLLVSLMLYFFRFVYGEVITAMPVNGGSYTALSNITSKRVAALAACLGLISYIATAVVSAVSAVAYLQLQVPAIDNATGDLCGTIAILFTFAVLNLLGVSESAYVAAAMFTVHIICLIILILLCLVWGFNDGWVQLKENLNVPYPHEQGPVDSIFWGYCAALLGITGFETAANYVEEMRDGPTVVATLRNLWASAAFFNPVLGFLSLAVMPLEKMRRYEANLLGPVAGIVGGPFFKSVICIDGFIVLSGAVLTAYVGVGGLVRRMASDRCLPSFLLALSSRGTPHVIILGFFSVASSLFIALKGDVDLLGAVFNISFLSVMAACAIACGLLKWKRPDLPRLVVSPRSYVALALFSVLAGLIGNIVRKPVLIAWVSLYFGFAVIIVFTMFNRTAILRAVLTQMKRTLATVEERRRLKNYRRNLVRAHAEHEEISRSAPETLALSIHIDDILASKLDKEEDCNAAVEEPARFQEQSINGTPPLSGWRKRLLDKVESNLRAINSQPNVFFSKYSDLETLNKAVLYVRDNEQTQRLVVVHIADDSESIHELIRHWAEKTEAASSEGAHVLGVPGSNALDDLQGFKEIVGSGMRPLSRQARELFANVALLDAAYPKLRIDLLVIRGTVFGPAVIQWVERRFNIGPNSMFMAMPDACFPHSFASLGGLRVITRSDDRTRTEREARVRAVLAKTTSLGESP